MFSRKCNICLIISLRNISLLYFFPPLFSFTTTVTFQDGNGEIDFDEFHYWYTVNIMDTKKLEGRKLTKAQLKMARNVGRMKSSMKNWVKEKMKQKIHPKVPGTDALIIRSEMKYQEEDEFEKNYLEDVKRVKPKFWWWARDQFGLDKDLGPSVDEQRDFTPNELEAFDMLFKNQWNSGKLPIKYYHDGRKFFKKGKFWRQRWNHSENKFYFTDENSGYTTDFNPDPSPAELAARAKEKAAQRAKDGAQGFKNGMKSVGTMAFKGGAVIGKGLMAGGVIVGREIMKLGATKEVKTLMNLGYSRKIAMNAVEMVPNLNDDEPPTDALLEAQLRMAMQLQLERDAFLQERAQRLRDEPNLGMIALKEVSKFGRTLVDLLRQRKKNVLTEEEKKEHQLNNLRRDLYGDGGMPAEEIDLQSSDDEDAW